MKKKLIVFGVIGVFIIGSLLLAKNVLRVRLAEEIVAPIEQIDPDSLTVESFDIPVSQEFVNAYKLFLKEGWNKVDAEGKVIGKYTSEEAISALGKVASKEMTDTTEWEILTSQVLISLDYLWRGDVHNAYLEAKKVHALAKQSSLKDDTRLATLDTAIPDIEAGKLGVKETLALIKSAISQYEEVSDFVPLTEERVQAIENVARLEDGTYYDEEIAKMKAVVSGDYDINQKAEAQFKIAQATSSKMTSGHATVEQVVAEYQKVINNYPDTEWATKALKRKADLLASHSTIAHLEEAIETYILYLQRINPYSKEAEEVLKSIEKAERGIQEKEGKIVKGIALPPLVETPKARQVVEARKKAYIKILDEETFARFLSEVNGLPTTTSKIEKINSLLVEDLALNYKAELNYQKALVYEGNKEMKKAVFCLLDLIEQYPTTSAYIRANEEVKRLCAEKTVQELIGTYEEASKGVKMILAQRQLNPDKYLFELALSLESGKDYVGAIENYKKICSQFPNSEYFQKAKDKLLEVYTLIGRPDKATAFLNSLKK